MEPRDVVALMAAIIFAVRRDSNEQFKDAVDDAVELYEAVNKVKTSRLIRHG